jgi:hypothetical protein
MSRLFEQYPNQKFVQGVDTQADLTQYAKTAGGVLPGIGDAISAYDAYKAFQEGNYGEAGLNALGILPFIPSLGGITKNVSKETKDILSKYFDKSALEAVNAPLDYKSRETVVLMSPDDFLNYASQFEKGKPNSSKLKAIEKRFAKGDKLPKENLPYLMFDTEKGVANITGHEGRHRATYLKNQGVNLIPVRVKSSDIRWSEQGKPTSFDFVENWPSTLENQSQTGVVPFPFSREGEYISTLNQQQTVPDKFWSKEIEPVYSKQEIDDLFNSLNYKDPFGDTTK